MLDQAVMTAATITLAPSNAHLSCRCGTGGSYESPYVVRHRPNGGEHQEIIKGGDAWVSQVKKERA